MRLFVMSLVLITLFVGNTHNICLWERYYECFDNINYPLDNMTTTVDTISLFDIVIHFILKHEGSSYVYDKSKNEVSRRGITLSTFRSYYGYGDNNTIKNITEEQAKKIYKSLFWDRHNMDSIVLIGYPKTAMVLIDSEINIGPYRANKFLQKILDVPHKNVNGSIDSITLDYIRTSNMTDEQLSYILLKHRQDYYSRLVKKNNIYSKYYKGWNNRLESMSKFLEEI